MSKLTFSNTGVTTGQPVLASQVSQSFNAFTGAGDYAITISGSLTTAANSKVSLGGDLVLTDNVSAISQSNFTASAGGGGNVLLKYNEATKLATSNTGITVTGEVDATSIDVTSITASANAVIAGDISAVEITASGDLDVQGNTRLGNAETDRISITGSLAMEDPASGTANVSMSVKDDEFKLITNADATSIIGTPQLTIKGSDEAETLAVFNQDSDVRLFYNNTRRFATTNEGAYISGSATTTGLEVHDGTNTAVRSATQTRFNFAGDTYVSNESTSGAARVAFALGGTTAANAKVAVSASNDLHVYSGSINVGSGQSTFTGSFGISKGNLNANATQNAVGYQSAEFYINQQNINATPDLIFRYYPWDSSDRGTYPLPALDNSNCYVVTMHVNLVLMQRGSDLVNPADKVGYLEYSSAFGLRGPGYQVAELTGGGVTIANKTSNILTSGVGEFFIASPGTDQAYIAVSIDNGGSNIPGGAFPQIGGTVKITVAQQIA
tara:strand:+ start:561 stop:2054 length:1494 start_codon:yes stop_codon:yes gene_type:complete